MRQANQAKSLNRQGFSCACQLLHGGGAAMSFGFSLGDIIKAIKIADDICKAWWHPIQRAGIFQCHVSNLS